MADMDLAGFLDGELALVAHLQELISGVEELVNPPLTQEEKKILLDYRDLLILWRDTAQRIAEGIQKQIDLGYPIIPPLIVTEALEKKLLEGIRLEQSAMEQIQGAVTATGGTLLWSEPKEKPEGNIV